MPDFLCKNLTYLADSVLQITSFKDHAEIKIFDYDGTLRILKQPRMNGIISAPLIDTDVYALKISQKTGLHIERIHLDPEEDRA